MSTNEAAERLLKELQENPLPGARHAYSIVRDRLPAILAHEHSAGAAPLDVERLAMAIEDHQDDDGMGFRHACLADCAPLILARLAEGTDR